jgi:hypothetical protein
LAYYGRLLAIGLSRPDRVLEPVDAWRPRVTAPDLTGVRRWLSRTWDVNRAFSTATVAALLGALALATSAGAFGGPEAAAGPPPGLSSPTGFVEPVASGDLPLPVGSDAP